MGKNILGSAQKVDLTIFQPLGPTLQRADLAAVQTLARPNTDPTPTKLMVQVTGQNNVRYTLDGSMPTPAFGFSLIAGGAATVLTIHQSTTVQVVEAAATATLTYCWGH